MPRETSTEVKGTPFGYRVQESRVTSPRACAAMLSVRRVRTPSETSEKSRRRSSSMDPACQKASPAAFAQVASSRSASNTQIGTSSHS